MDIARTAEEVGFDRIAVANHVWQHTIVGGPEADAPECYTTLAFVAVNTEHTRLTAMVSGVPFRYPTILVKAAQIFGVGSHKSMMSTVHNLARRCRDALAGDAQYQDCDIVARGLLLEVQNGTLYTAGDGRSIQSNRGAQEGHEPLLTELETIRGASFYHAVGVQDQGIAGFKAGLLLGKVCIVEYTDGASWLAYLDASVGLEQKGRRVAVAADGDPNSLLSISSVCL